MADDTQVPSGENPNELTTDGLGTPNQVADASRWDNLLEGLNKMGDTLGERLGSKLDTIRDTVTETTRPPQSPPDYASMSNAELVAHVTSTVHSSLQEAIQTALKPLFEQVNGIQTDLVTTRGSLDLKDAQDKHKDLKEWKGEMIELARAHPTLTLEHVYQLAKAGNPDKVRQLETKYNPPAPKPRPFGGLTPSGNGRAREPVLTGEDSVRAAYREVSERHAGILPLLNDL